MLQHDAKRNTCALANLAQLFCRRQGAFNRLFHQDRFARRGQRPHKVRPCIRRRRQAHEIQTRILNDFRDIAICARSTKARLVPFKKRPAARLRTPHCPGDLDVWQGGDRIDIGRAHHADTDQCQPGWPAAMR